MTESVVDIRKHPAYDGLIEACQPGLELVRRGSWLIVQGYWQIGQVIVRYEQEGVLDFSYGANTMACLAQDLGFRDPTLLYRMKEAAIRYPTEEALNQARRELASSGKDQHWTNFRYYCLPQDTKEPHRYGGKENVVEAKLSRIESLVIEISQVKDMYHDMTDDQKEQTDGVFLAVRQELSETRDVLQSLPCGKYPPERSEEYLDYIRSLSCCVCGEPPPSDPHHLKRAGLGGMGMKPPDYFAIPLCRKHHQEIQENRKSIDWEGMDLWHEVAKCLMAYIQIGGQGGE